MLIIDFTKNTESVVTEKVLGLTVAERHALCAQGAGCDNLYMVVPAPQQQEVRDLLEKHPKLQIPFEVSENSPATEENTLVLPGGTLLTTAGMKGFLEGEWNLDSIPEKHRADVAGDGVRAAETILLKSLVKDADGIVSRNINRKISLFLSRRLAKWPISPNHVTAVVFLIGVCSGPFAFFMGSYWGFTLGALCYYISAILDGCDGEISRLKYSGSPMGAWLDTIVDDLVGLSYIIGLYGRLALDTEGVLWTYVGIGTIAMYLLTILPRYWVMARTGSGDFQKLAATKKPKEIKGFMKVVEGVRSVIFRTDFLPFYAFVTAASGCVLAFAVPFAVGAVASAIDSIIDTIKVKKYLQAQG